MLYAKILSLTVLLCCLLLQEAHGLSRIVGGIGTTIDRRPYQASLQYISSGRVSHTCGASIISPKYLLSAAHCSPGSNLHLLYARVGSTTYNTGGQVLKIDRFISHTSYNPRTLDYDFAILTFPVNVQININQQTTKIIALPSSTQTPQDNTFCTASGWGATSDSAPSTPLNLREVNLPVMNQARCRQYFSFITARQICMGGTPQGNLNVCFGDSGGPAVQNGVQYGVASGVSGSGCQAPNYPGIFARVSSVRSWITQLTGV